PREPIRLVMEEGRVRAKNVTDQSQDFTDKLAQLATAKIPQLADVCGYIFMQKSPSCGLFRVKAYLPTGMPHNEPQTGIYSKVNVSPTKLGKLAPPKSLNWPKSVVMILCQNRPGAVCSRLKPIYRRVRRIMKHKTVSKPK